MNFRVMFLIALAGFYPGGGTPADAQILHATGDLPSFEVATIKPWKPPAPSPPPSDGATGPAKVMKLSPVGGGGQATDRVHMILPISLLIASAYNLPVGSESRRIQGPDWLRQDEQYEIQARIGDAQFAAMQRMTAAQQHEQVALMEQSLLADRFRLKAHFETKEMPVYALAPAKGGAKLTAAKDGEAARLSTLGNRQESEMTGTAVTLDEFVRSPLLTGAAGRLVVDRTGLKGAYDFTLRWEPDQVATDSPSLFTAIQEQLGLRLVASRAAVEVIIVDHIEQPSVN